MALEYSNQKATSVISSFGGGTDVVVQVTMTCKNTESNNFMDVTVALDMDNFDPSSGFTNLADVTGEQLAQWAVATAPEYFATIEEQLA